jgi:hypothetical protein
VHKKEIEGVGLSVIGYEEDFIEFIDGRTVGMHNFAPESVDWEVASAVVYVGADDCRDAWKECMDEYIKETGRQFPKLFKFKITCEAEELSEKEITEYWQGKQNKYKESCREYKKKKTAGGS